MAVDNRQNPERPAIEKPVRHEVHGPDIVGTIRLRNSDGSTLLIGGFMVVGSPHRMIDATGTSDSRGIAAAVGVPEVDMCRKASGSRLNCFTGI